MAAHRSRLGSHERTARKLMRIGGHHPIGPSAVAGLVDFDRFEVLDVMGPRVQLLGSPGDAPCLIRGTIAPDVFVPLHSHADPETFIHLSGELEGLRDAENGFEWVPIRAGQVFHVSSGAKHAFRNRGRTVAVSIVATTPRLGQFFRDIGLPVRAGDKAPAPPSSDRLRHVLATAKEYGHWNGTPQENARVGLALPRTE